MIFIFGISRRFFTLNRYHIRSKIKSIQSFVEIQFYCRSSLWYKLSKDPSDSAIHLNFFMKISVLENKYFKIFSYPYQFDRLALHMWWLGLTCPEGYFQRWPSVFLYPQYTIRSMPYYQQLSKDWYFYEEYFAFKVLFLMKN